MLLVARVVVQPNLNFLRTEGQTDSATLNAASYGRPHSKAKLSFKVKLGTCESFFFRSNRIFESNRAINHSYHLNLTNGILYL